MPPSAHADTFSHLVHATSRDNEVVYVTCGEDLAPQRVVLSVEAVLRERSTDGSGGAGEGGLAQPQGNGQRRGADGAAAGSNACVDAANGTARVRAAGGGGAGGGGAGGAVSDQPRPAVGALVAATVSLAPFPEQKQADDAVSSVGRSGSPHAPKAATPSGDGAGSQNTVSCGNCQGRGRIDGFYAQFCVFYEARTNAAPRCVCSFPPCRDTPASLATIGLLTFCLPCWLLTCCVCGEAVPLVKKKCKRCRGSGAVAWDAKLARFVPAFPEASEGIKPMESERG
eukprot:3859019-Pleurochrysis_carterae.AAC.2